MMARVTVDRAGLPLAEVFLREAMGKLGSLPGPGWQTLPLGPMCPLRTRIGRLLVAVELVVVAAATAGRAALRVGLAVAVAQGARGG